MELEKWELIKNLHRWEKIMIFRVRRLDSILGFSTYQLFACEQLFYLSVLLVNYK